jgi:hypothetical protein
MTTTNDIVRNIRFLGDAVRLVAQHAELSSEALVEHYPTRHDAYGPYPAGRIFAYQFFDKAGGNCAYYLPEFNSVHLFAIPRKWGMPKAHMERIEHYVNSDSLHCQA